MAARVNTRFVVMLSAVLVLVFGGVAAMAFFVLTRSGSELEKAGDQKMAEGEYKAAMLLYGKAFVHDRNRVDRAEKYCQAIEAWTPPNESEYSDAYISRYMGALQTLAQLRPLEVPRQETLLGELHRQLVRMGASAEAARSLADTAGRCLEPFQASSAPPPGWERLRRYRGLALLTLHQADARGVSERERATLEEDLKAALAADPGDDEVAVALANWTRRKAAMAAEAHDQAQADVLRDQAEAMLAAYAAEHPQSLRAAMTLLEFRLDRAINAVPGDDEPAKVYEARVAAARSFQGDIDALAAACLAAPERLTPDLADKFVGLERFVTVGKPEKAARVVAALVERNPANAMALTLAAGLAGDEQRLDDALAAYQRVLELKVPPVSLDGFMLWGLQTNAVRRQVELVLAQWQGAEPQDKPALLDRVRAQRQALDARLPSGHPLLLLLDAKIRIAEGDSNSAQRLLIDYNRKTEDTDVDGLRLLAQVEQTLNRPGEARRLWDKVLAIEPGNTAAYRAKAELLLGMQDYAAADQTCLQLLARDPQNPWAIKMRETIAVIRGDAGARAADPVLEVTRQALSLSEDRPDGRPGDPVAALALLEKAIPEHNHDARLYDVAIAVAAQAKDWGKAKALAQAGSAANPDSARLKDLLRVVSADDPVGRRLVEIDVGPGSDSEKAALKHRVLKEAGRAEEADAILADLRSRPTEDPVAVELLFVTALESKDLAQAKRLADLAAAKNLDRVDGLTFKARMQINEGAKNEAIATLRQATKMGTATAETWRLLGAMLYQEGRPGEALEAFAEAKRLKPTDLVTTLGYLNAQVRLQMLPEALTTAREAARFAKDNPDFMDLWLRLEEAVGDKTVAAARRETRLAEAPQDAENRKSLARLYIALTEWDKARALIDSLRKEGDSLELMRLDAVWSADQGDFERAEKVFRDRLAALPPAAPGAPSPAHEELLVALGEFLVARTMHEPGLNALREARAYEDPAKLNASRALGAALFQVRGNETEAVEVLRQVLRAGADDPDYSMRCRLAESLVGLREYDEAQALIKELGPAVEKNLPLMLLLADAHRGKLELDEARRLLDRLVVDFSEEGLVFVKRAETMRQVALADPKNIRKDLLVDARADCTTALRARPNYWQALQLRAMINNDLGEREAALADLRAAVKINPDLDGARDALIREYLNAGRISEAVAVGTEAVDQKPRDLPTMLAIGDIFFDGAFWSEAAEFYRRAWDIARTGPVAARYSLALLRATPPDLARADAILAAPELNIEKAPPLLMTRALLRARQPNAGRQAREDAAKAIHLTIPLPHGVESTGMMLDRLGEVFRAPGEIVDFMNQHLDLSPLPDQWAAVYRAKVLLTDPTEKVRAEARPLLESALAKSADPSLKLTARRYLGALLLSERKYEEMVEMGRRGLAELPAGVEPQNEVEKSNCIEMNNNIAYVLCENLGRAEEALPYAERAAALAPSSPPVLDTLGVCLLRLGRLDQAEEVLTRARSIYAPAEAHIACTLHLGQVYVGKKNCDGSREMLRVADAILNDYPHFRGEYQKSLDDLRARIEADCR